MKLPFTFKEYIKSPFAAISLLCVMGMGYLYIDARSANTDLIEACMQDKQDKQERINKLETDVADLQTKFIELVQLSTNK